VILTEASLTNFSQMYVSVGFCFAVAMGVVPDQAAAFSKQEVDWCFNKAHDVSPELQIKGCTAVIDSGRMPTDLLAAVSFFRAEAYAKKLDLDHAIADFTQSLQADAKNPNAFFNRGLMYHIKNDNDRAIADFNQAIQISPNHIGAYTYRGAAYNDKGDYNRAMADFDRAIEIDSTYPRAYYERGLAKRTHGDKAGGDADIAHAKQLDPNLGR
jgi:tetratricopeptide (TPR) repeat protein